MVSSEVWCLSLGFGRGYFVKVYFGQGLLCHEEVAEVC